MTESLSRSLKTTRDKKVCSFPEEERLVPLKRTEFHLICRLPPHFRDSVFNELLEGPRGRRALDTRSQSCKECARRFNLRYESTVSMNRIQLTRRAGAFTSQDYNTTLPGTYTPRAIPSNPSSCINWTSLGRSEKQFRETLMHQVDDIASTFPKICMSPDVTKITPQKRGVRKTTSSPLQLALAPPPTPIRRGNCSPTRTWTYLIGVR